MTATPRQLTSKTDTRRLLRRLQRTPVQPGEPQEWTRPDGQSRTLVWTVPDYEPPDPIVLPGSRREPGPVMHLIGRVLR